LQQQKKHAKTRSTTAIAQAKHRSVSSCYNNVGIHSDWRKDIQATPSAETLEFKNFQGPLQGL